MIDVVAGRNVMNQQSGEPILHTALLQFIFPFSITKGQGPRLAERLGRDGFTPFFLDRKELQHEYYGDGYCVSHEHMERSYMPFAAHVLFPRKGQDHDTFRRFSRVNGLECTMELTQCRIPFQVLSTDVFICPFQLGFVTVRTRIEGDRIPLKHVLEFADRFRSLENVTEADAACRIVCEDKSFEQMEDFVFRNLVKGLEDFLDQSDLDGAYFETLPFFVDERMMVQAFYGLEDGAEIDPQTCYRASQLDGMTQDGSPYTSASSAEYIEDYCRDHRYSRWGPDTYYMTNEQTFCCLSRSGPEISLKLANQMYGEYYYGLLLSLFHKIVLLKLANVHSRLRIERDNEEIQDLIYYINKFSAKFYFVELISQTQGREIFYQLRKVYGNDELFEEVKQTLADLFQYQEKFQAKRRDNLLMILTVFTVVSGIYGMNQVIDDLKGSIDWSKMSHYSLFEYLALFLTFSGITVSAILTIRELWGSIRSRLRRRKFE
ncbi:hypothetical protein D3C81_236430 [compost metagenome]